MGCETIINLQQEGGEQIIGVEREMTIGGAVKSVNGMTGDVVLTTSDLENTSDYQTGSEVESAISTAVGAEATLRENADTALGGRIDNLVTGLGNETTARQTADNSLQGQIDAITASSDVTDIVGTKAQLDNYDTSKLNDNDIIKVLQDESQNDETTYYRWSTSTHTFTLIGEEGPYYTKAQSNELLQAKQDKLTAGTNIDITNNVISATDTTYTAGNAITIDANNEISADIYPADYFTASATQTATGTSIEFEDTIPAALGAVEMYGDSTQQTYTGVNLFNVNDANNVGSGVSVDSDGFITVTYDNTSGTGNHYENYFTNNLNLQTSTNYAVVVEVKSVTGNGRAFFATNNQVAAGYSQLTTNYYQDFSSLSAGTVLVGAVTTQSSFSTPGVGIRTSVRFEPGQSGSVTFRLSVLADTTITPETFVYQPFVGGTASPNPDFPQPVHTVTGTQIFTLSDGVSQTATYTVDLGSIELCKIGDYQDYIYKSGDDWYVHKDIGKYTFDGTENWETSQYGTNSWRLRNFIDFPFDTDKLQIISNIFVGIKHADRNTAGNNVIYTATTKEFDIRNTTFTSQANVQTATNGNYIYYALATETDTKITDATLVAQLDALSQAKTYFGATNITITATGTNLVASSKFTVYKNSAAGVATREAVSADAPTYSDFIGTDGNTPGASGLVPAPATTDVDKFLKSDGTWATAGGGGGGVTPVQTTGTSTTDVMSQDATTKMIYPDITNNPYKMLIGTGSTSGAKGTAINGTIASNSASGLAIGLMDGNAQIGSAGRSNASIAIGDSASAARGDNSVAIGSNAFCNSGANQGYNVAIGYNAYAGNASKKYSVALGAYSKTTRDGEVDVSTGSNNHGYNSTDYRVIGGVHDGQLAHDVATVGQINATIDAINTALSLNIPHIGA